MILIYCWLQLISAQSNVTMRNSTEEYEDEMRRRYEQCTNPTGPEVRCDLVPAEYVDCSMPKFKSTLTIGNDTNVYETCFIEELGGQYHELVKEVYVTCTVLDDVDCCGERAFFKKGLNSKKNLKLINRSIVPCIRHQISQEDGKCMYSYPTSVILSIFLGIAGNVFILYKLNTTVRK